MKKSKKTYEQLKKAEERSMAAWRKEMAAMHKQRLVTVAELHRIHDKALMKSLRDLDKARDLMNDLEQGPFAMIFPTPDHYEQFEDLTELLFTYVRFYEEKLQAAGYVETDDGVWIKSESDTSPSTEAKSPAIAEPKTTKQTQPERPLMIVSHSPGKKNGAATKKQAEQILPEIAHRTTR